MKMKSRVNRFHKLRFGEEKRKKGLIVDNYFGGHWPQKGTSLQRTTLFGAFYAKL